MDDTTRKSLITVIEIIIILVVLYVVSIYIQNYLDSLEGEAIVTAIKALTLI